MCYLLLLSSNNAVSIMAQCDVSWNVKVIKISADCITSEQNLKIHDGLDS